MQETDRFARLAKLAQQLNRAADEATPKLKAAEDQLDRLQIGIDTELDEPLTEGPLREEFDPPDPDRPAHYREREFLAYGRYSPGPAPGRWRLLIRTWRFVENRDDPAKLVDETPVLDCARELRIAAVGHLDKLLSKLAERAELALGLSPAALVEDLLKNEGSE